MGRVDEGQGLRMRAGTQRRRTRHVGGGLCASVGRGTLYMKVGASVHGRAAGMGGGQRAWEEGDGHGRRAACVSGGRGVKVRAETCDGRPRCVGRGVRPMVGAVMTCSTPSPDPVPAPARPRTDPRRFIADALRVTSHHVTPSCCAPPHDARPLEVHVGFLPAL